MVYGLWFMVWGFADRTPFRRIWSTRGQKDVSLNQFPFKCYLPEAAFSGDGLKICHWVASRVDTFSTRLVASSPMPPWLASLNKACETERERETTGYDREREQVTGPAESRETTGYEPSPYAPPCSGLYRGM